MHQIGIHEFYSLREMEFFKFHHSLKNVNGYSKSHEQSSTVINNHENEIFIKLKINDLRIAFASLIFGAIITILTLFIEIFVYIKLVIFK